MFDEVMRDRLLPEPLPPDSEWEFLNEDRFEVGLGWILDGIAARYER